MSLSPRKKGEEKEIKGENKKWGNFGVDNNPSSFVPNQPRRKRKKKVYFTVLCGKTLQEEEEEKKNLSSFL